MEGLSPRSISKLVMEFLGLGPRGLFRFLFGYRKTLISDELFFQMLLEGYSLVRWGDGETAIARGKSISYQQPNTLLASYLQKLLIALPDKTILGIPWAFSASIFSRKWNLRYWKIFLSTKILLSRKFNLRSPVLVDTEVWYRLFTRIPELLLNLSSKSTLLLVSGNRSFMKICPEGTRYLSVPLKNAFNDFDMTKTAIDEIVKNSKQVTLVLAAGPLSKALAFEFAGQVQVIDVGHGFDFQLHGLGIFAWVNDKNSSEIGR